MTSKHITRDFSSHRRSVIRPYDEFCGLEIFSFDPKHTQYYLCEENKLKGSNYTKSSYRAWTVYKSTDKQNDMVLEFSYNVKENGEYRIDFIYEQNSRLWNNKDYDTSNDLNGDITITKGSSTVYDSVIRFDGEDNILKRIPLFLDLQEGVHNVEFEVPPNCVFMGVLVRKIIKYSANNYFGADSGKDSGNMMLTSATVSLSDMTKPSELTCKIGYDDAFECDESPSGFYIDYMDEVNFYVKDDDGQIERVFGGYVSSILPNANRTELDIHCADRLNDGTNKYILDEMELLNGSEQPSEKKYTTKNFKNYAHALKYLCDSHEVTLKSNITKNYLVDGEKYSNGLTIAYGKNKDITKIPVSNGKATTHNNYITIRNNASGDKKQTWTLYDAKKHTKKPVLLSDKGYMHITYGLGKPETTKQIKNTQTVDASNTNAGSQKFTKCGVSEDKKYVVFIGQASVNESYKKYGNKIIKRIYENKCPNCGKATLRYDDGKKNGCITNHGHHGNKTSVPEGEITCASCDCDFDGAMGKEKITGSKKRLKAVTSVMNSSQKEKDLLIKGKFKAVPKTGVEITPDSIFKAITKIGKQYKYKRGSSSTYSSMKKTGSGDCHAFSDLIFTELKKYDVTCKIVQYATGYSDTHRSVLYKDKDNKWVDFPYRKYGWNKMLYNTSGSSKGSKVNSYKGVNIGSVKVKSKTTTKKETTQLTVTKGYNKDKPFQGYLKLIYSRTQSFNAKKYTLYIKFTLSTSNGTGMMNKGFPLYWINNATRKSTLLNDEGKPWNISDYIQQATGYRGDLYLHSIHMVAPKKIAKTENEDTDYYKYDKSTHDNSSCKLDLYQIVFNNDSTPPSSELDTAGKSIINVLKQIVDDTGYYVDMTYGLHRKDDVINFRVNNTSEATFIATEGNNNNILSWNSISYSPISSLYNNSVQVYMKDDGNYYYVQSRYPRSVFEYGEQTTLETSNEKIGDKEAYYNARMNGKFNGEQTYSFTITVPNYPDLRLGELVQVTANARKLNTIKEVKSLKISFSKSDMPRIKTEIGLDELAPDIQLRENIRKLRRDAKKETTWFLGCANPTLEGVDGNSNDIYIWDR